MTRCYSRPPDGGRLSFFHSRSGFVSVMVTAGLLPEGDRPAIAEMLMRDNPARCGSPAVQ